MEKQVLGGLEWRINVPDGTSKEPVPECSYYLKPRLALKGFLVVGLMARVLNFLEKAWALGVSEPKKVIHGMKVGIALSLVSLFYYMRPLYDGVGGNAMWAVMTVVVVFEYNVGATLCKSLNRVTGTFLAGSLGIGVHWVASQSGEKLEPIILGISVFILASAATFSRFMPSVKARFDYGAMIFILTFSLVSVSGYRVDKLFGMAHQRLSTIAIGTSLCIIISMFVSPIWAGDELHQIIHRNMEKLAESLEGCVGTYFKDNQSGHPSEGDSSKKTQAYKCVLNSKATEESMANFAMWEPPHGPFNFRHPWKEYLKIGAVLRSCACCIDALSGCLDSEKQATEHLKVHLRDASMAVCSHSCIVLRELSMSVKTTTNSSKLHSSVGEMNFALQELQNALKSLPTQLILQQPFPDESSENKSNNEKECAPPVLGLIPLATLVSLLTEIAARIEETVDGVVKLAELAEFKASNEEKRAQNQSTSNNQSSDHPSCDTEPRRPFQRPEFISTSHLRDRYFSGFCKLVSVEERERHSFFS
ncbi:aluminum-activated malate transporter 10-like [Rhodamnia argentea]|uniref:Aluminum-activated malate transporter 10-like n=1 Tax=Rhodamnia argentea TaxID=178133 RepID=A0A8B8QLH5_9MYRT|nr:aluminum-activated malate transporter 10-like [Rhodamnia argentea]